MNFLFFGQWDSADLDYRRANLNKLACADETTKIIYQGTSTPNTLYKAHTPLTEIIDFCQLIDAF